VAVAVAAAAVAAAVAVEAAVAAGGQLRAIGAAVRSSSLLADTAP
jgi:hypothetical protein